MKTHSFKSLAFLVTAMFLLTNLYSQEDEKKKDEEGSYKFETIVEVETTPVKDQHRSGTCWAFATISFLESELIKSKGEVYDLSEMYVIRETYPEKAVQYVRMHGNVNFGPGGQAHDVTNVIKKYGIVPENVYPGLEIGEEKHNHGEMDAVLKAMLKAIISKKGGKITPVWLKAYNAVLDVYLGKVPENFEYEGKSYTAKSFAQNLNIDPDDYIEITSFTHHPFYKKIELEIPDNWSGDEYYNVPVDDLINIMNHALENGYSIAWDGDVSEKDFMFKKGVATVPQKERNDKKKNEKDSANLFPGSEIEVTQLMRQQAFDNYTSTDDHLMHITGIAKDQFGNKYYITKNSWAEDSNDHGGYLNLSEPYIRLKTIAIMINKNALPANIKKRLRVE